MSNVSLEALARFAVLPGAAELIEAFSMIPPGPMRDAVLHLAQTTASTYQGGPQAQPYRPEFIAPGAPAKGGPGLRLGRAPPTESREAKAVQLRIDHPDMKTAEIAKKTGLSNQQVYQAIYAARRAGAPIPKRRVITPDERGTVNWPVSVDEMTPQGLGAITAAANNRRITAQAYLDRRQLALKLAMEGAGYERIMKATGEKDAKVVSAWLSKARQAGFAVPYMTYVDAVDEAPQPEPEAPALEAVIEPLPAAPRALEAPTQTDPQAAPAAPPSGRVFQSAKDMRKRNATQVEAAAARHGLTLEAYEQLREDIVKDRLAGKSTTQIATDRDKAKQFVKDTLGAAANRGVVFPPLPSHGGRFVSEEEKAA